MLREEIQQSANVLIQAADTAYDNGSVETPMDYIEPRIPEYFKSEQDQEAVWMFIQRIFEVRATRYFN